MYALGGSENAETVEERKVVVVSEELTLKDRFSSQLQVVFAHCTHSDLFQLLEVIHGFIHCVHTLELAVGSGHGNHAFVDLGVSWALRWR